MARDTLGSPVGNRAVTFFSSFFTLKPQSILPPPDGPSLPSLVWEGYGICPCGQLRGRIFQGGQWRGAQFKLTDFVGVTLYGNGNLLFSPRAGQIPIISLLGASPEPSSHKLPNCSHFSLNPSVNSKLRARGHSLGSTQCPFGTVALLRSSSCVLGATSPEKQSCLKNFTLLS